MIQTKDIQQTAEFPGVTPHDVYETLMDSKKHAKFTGSPANIKRRVGETSQAYDAWIEAVNLEIIPDKKIVQKWRGGDWPAGHYSIATFVLASSKNGTVLTFTQTGVPGNKYADISDGWKEQYWEKMQKLLKK